jgi:hypothetical protein
MQLVKWLMKTHGIKITATGLRKAIRREFPETIL